MKDIDFDELDRAVSSALGDTAKTADSSAPPVSPAPSPAAPSEDVSDPVSVTAPDSVAPQPVPVQPETQASPTPAPEPIVPAPAPDTAPAVEPSALPTIQTSPAARRGGRFMDVVHPSSDMKTTAPRVPKRTVGPISSDLTSEQPTTTSVSPAPAPEPVVSPETTSEQPQQQYPTLDTLSAASSPRLDAQPDQQPQEQEPAAPETDWPDPINQTEPAPAPAGETPSGNVEATDQPVDQTEVAQPAVEHTPEATQTEESSDPNTTQTPFLADAKVDKRPLGSFATGAASNDETIPSFGAGFSQPELEADLVKIESNGSTQTQAAPVAAQPADNDAVFDPSAYHQPIAPKTKGKNKTWIWVMLIIGLLIVGAALGALFFMAGF